MSLKVGELHARLDLDRKPFEKGLSRSEGRFRGFAGSLAKGAAAAGLGVSAALGAAAAKGVADFAGFEQGMNEVFTLLPGISESAMSDMEGQVKDFSKEFGVLPDNVVPALYQALSAGVPPDNVFDFLETGQKAAKGGVTDLTTAVDGISSVVNAYGDDVIDASKASDLMFTAVKRGKTNFEELSSSLFNVTPTASALGVKFEDVTAAMATMTAQGTPTSVATTQMRQLLVELSKDGSKASDAFKEIAGEGFQEFIAGGGDVNEALGVMQDAAADNGLALQDMFGSVEAGQAALSLTKGDAFAENLREMGAAAGSTDEAFGTMDQGLSATFDRLKAAVSVALQDLGEKLAPTIEAIAAWIIENWPKISETFSVVFSAIGEAIAVAVEYWPIIRDTIAAIFETVRTIIETAVQWWQENMTGIGDSTSSTAEWLGEIWDQIVGIIRAASDLIRAIIDRVTSIVSWIWENHGKTITRMISGVWNGIKAIISSVMGIIRGIIDTFTGLISGDWSKAWNGIKRVFSSIWGAIRGVIAAAWSAFSGWWSIMVDGLARVWEGAWERIKGFFSGIWEGIKSVIRSSINTILGWVEGFVNSIIDGINRASGMLNKLPGVNIGSVGKISLPRYHSGGVVPGPPGSEQLAVLEAGETVIPARRSDRGSGGGVTIEKLVVQGTPERIVQDVGRAIGTEIRWASG